MKSIAAYHPDLALREVGKEVKELLDKYGDPTQLAQNTESGILHNLLQDLELLGDTKLTSTGLKPWVAALKSREDEFLAAVKQRTEEEAQRMTGIVKQTRTAAEAAYR